MTSIKSMILSKMPIAMSRRRAQELVDELTEQEPTVRFSVVVPAYREGERIEATVEEIGSALRDAVEGTCEILVVDDGSDDDTGDAASRSGADVVIHCRHNRGRGAALRRGLMVASGETMAYLDADLSYSPDQLVNLLEAIEAGADVAVGDRRHADSTISGSVPFKRRIASRLMHTARMSLKLGNHDTQCGFKAFSRSAVEILVPQTVMDRWAWDVEVVWLADRLGMTVVDVPVALADRSDSSVRLLRDGIEMLRDMIRIRIRAVQGRYPAAEQTRAVPDRPAYGPTSKDEHSAVYHDANV